MEKKNYIFFGEIEENQWELIGRSNKLLSYLEDRHGTVADEKGDVTNLQVRLMTDEEVKAIPFIGD